MSRAIVLVSGGLDSATTLAIAKSQGFEITALTFRYGQRHRSEVDAAGRVAESFGVVDHAFLDLSLGAFGGSALTAAIAIPKDRSLDEMNSGIPDTYVPARNTIFLSYALALAEARAARDIFIGVNAMDYSGYPDCRPEFINAFEALANFATVQTAVSHCSMSIHAPLIRMSKAEIIRTGLEFGVDFRTTVSCYDATDDGTACGHCDACLLRRRGFDENGIDDPTLYREQEVVRS